MTGGIRSMSLDGTYVMSVLRRIVRFAPQTAAQPVAILSFRNAMRPSVHKICVAERRPLWGQFEDQVHRRLRGATQIGKPGIPRHLAQALFARLRTEAEPNILRQRVWRARHLAVWHRKGSVGNHIVAGSFQVW